MTQFQDTTATCKDCGEGFTITSGEHAFFDRRQLLTPKRCAKCREKKRQNANKQENNN